jgi:hypothetical protein
MLTVLSIAISLFAHISRTSLAGNWKGCSQCWVGVMSILKWKCQVDQPNFCSNLSGPFFLFDPLSDLGFLIARIFGHIPYLLVGGTWAPGGKYEGTCT